MGIKETKEYFDSLPKDVLEVMNSQEFIDYGFLISKYNRELSVPRKKW